PCFVGLAVFSTSDEGIDGPVGAVTHGGIELGFRGTEGGAAKEVPRPLDVERHIVAGPVSLPRPARVDGLWLIGHRVLLSGRANPQVGHFLSICQRMSKLNSFWP